MAGNPGGLACETFEGFGMPCAAEVFRFKSGLRRFRRFSRFRGKTSRLVRRTGQPCRLAAAASDERVLYGLNCGF